MLIDKKSTLSRLSQNERQVRGIRKMIEEERYCIDVLQQIGAIKAALSKVEDAVLKDHSKTCVAAAIASGNEAEQQKKFNELVDLLPVTNGGDAALQSAPGLECMPAYGLLPDCDNMPHPVHQRQKL